MDSVFVLIEFGNSQIKLAITECSNLFITSFSEISLGQIVITVFTIESLRHVYSCKTNILC